MFYCDICNRNYSTKQSLEEHLRSNKHQMATKRLKQGLNSRFECLFCNKTFSNKSNLKKHQSDRCLGKNALNKSNDTGALMCDSSDFIATPSFYIEDIKKIYETEIKKDDDEKNKLADKLDTLQKEYKTEILKLHEQYDVKIEQLRAQHKNEVDSLNREISYLKEKTVELKYKNEMIENSYNNNNSHNIVNSNHHNSHNQNIQIINANMLNERFPNVPSIEDVVEMAINDERYKITDNEKTSLLECKNNITDFSECLYQILFKRSIWLHYRNGALTDTINFPMLTTDINKRTSFVKTRGLWSFRGDNSSMMEALYNIDDFIKSETEDLLPFTNKQKLKICNKILKYNYYPSGEVFIPTSNKDPHLMNIIEKDLEKMIKNNKLHRHFRNLLKDHPDYKNSPNLVSNQDGPKKLHLKSDVNFRMRI